MVVAASLVVSELVLIVSNHLLAVASVVVVELQVVKYHLVELFDTALQVAALRVVAAPAVETAEVLELVLIVSNHLLVAASVAVVVALLVALLVAASVAAA